MMEPIRLWRVPIEHGELAWWFDPPLGNGTEYAALPRADFDAREARLARAEQERDEARDAEVLMARMREVVHAATARADALAALLKEARERAKYVGTHRGINSEFLARIDAATGEKK